MLVVQLQKEAVALPPVYGVPGVVAADPRLVEEDRKEFHWEHLRAPVLRWLWKEEATEAVIEFLEDARVGCRVSSRRALVDENRDREEGPGQGGEEGGPGLP